MEQTHEKHKVAKTYPISIATINFLHDGNIGFLIRSAACFGAECVHIVGPTPSRETIQALSEALGDYVKLKQHSSPKKFVEYTQQEGYNLVCVAPGAESEPLSTYTFDFSKPVCIVVGHEETGIPSDVVRFGDSVFIPTPGVGTTLNNFQTANVMLYEAVKRFEAQNNFLEEWVNACYIHYP